MFWEKKILWDVVIASCSIKRCSSIRKARFDISFMDVMLMAKAANFDGVIMTHKVAQAIFLRQSEKARFRTSESQ